ncbi:hypothetical protein LOZ58_006589, partial [Ophidiomyces ophidiicola]
PKHTQTTSGNRPSPTSTTTTAATAAATRHSRTSSSVSSSTPTTTTTAITTTAARPPPPTSHAHTASASVSGGTVPAPSRKSFLPQRHLTSRRSPERTVPVAPPPPPKAQVAPDIAPTTTTMATPLLPPPPAMDASVMRPNTSPSRRRDSLRSSPARRGTLGGGAGTGAAAAVKAESVASNEGSRSLTHQQQQASSTERSNTGQARAAAAAAQVPPATRLDRSASLRQTAPARVASTAARHTRNRSQVLVGSGQQAGGGAGAGAAAAAKNAPAEGASRAAKPSFNMYQQHYSPRKPAPKAAVNSASTVAAGDSNVAQALPLHIPPLQVELLQLLLLHSEGLQAKRKWEASMDAKCRELHSSVVKTYQSVLATERAVQRDRNVAALEQFAADVQACNGRYDFATQIQMLSRVIQEVSDLTESRDGRYNVVIQEFEEWSAHVKEVKQSRTQKTGGLQFIDTLRDGWRNDVAALSAKLELCSRELDCVEIRTATTQGDDRSGYHASALVRAVTGHRELIRSMIDELDVIATIESEVTMMERSWVTRTVDSLRIDIAPGQDGDLRIPAWKKT